MTWLLFVLGLQMALLAGVFLAFSDFIMRGLHLAPAAAGSAGMVGLNRTVYRSVFMVLFLGSVPASLGVAGFAVLRFDGAPQVLMIAGALVYLLGVFAVTGFGNVPMNNRLDRLADVDDRRAAYWPAYVRNWTALNHLRSASATLAAGLWLAAAQVI